jgi:hypothetical protein
MFIFGIIHLSMKKKILFLLACLFLIILSIPACQKDDNTPAPITKTQLLTQSSWTFEKATAGAFGDVSAQIPACYKDNVFTFLRNGTGNVNEGANVCVPSTARAFTWAFQNNETTLNISTTLFPGGSSTFTIVSLTETNLVISQPVTLPPPISSTVTVETTLKH